MAPPRDVEKPRNQVHQRRLAGAAAADDGHHLSGRHRERDVAQNRARMSVLVREADVAEFDRGRERRHDLRAAATPATSVCVSIISKMRSPAAIACCRLAFTRLSFFAGAYIMSRAARNDVNWPVVRRPAAISSLPYHSATAMPMPPEQLHERRHQRQRADDAHVGAIEVPQRVAKAAGLALFGAERLDDAMGGEGLGADVRHHFLRFLASARRAADRVGRAGRADRRRWARPSGRRARGAHRSRTGCRRIRRARAIPAADRRRFPTPPAAPVRRRSTRATAAVPSCCAQRSSPTARGCGRRAGRADPSRRAGRRPPSDSRRSTTRCP